MSLATNSCVYQQYLGVSGKKSPSSVYGLKYEDKYANLPCSVDKDLMTGTIWVTDDTTPVLPVRGQKVKILHFTRPLMYRNECCQFTTRYQDLLSEQETTKERISTEAATGDGKPKDIAKRVVSTPSEQDDTNDFPKIVTSVNSDPNNTKDLLKGAAAAIRPSIAPTKTTNDNAEPDVKLEPDPKKSKLQ
ncbi:hypothetical protein GN958_ATG10685 [Phytophthora infestans]|uniref:Uncharacterized protein n=1 Tax=Phytophthora infestans TaxID=4787 RepID=A0A8S9UKX1_PHYIN|nr:hypothetical protein GN958_ATG12606 [Phytophthora infestans]KAF4139209.1 hypothetical protein GN958_ATG11569 [Phytophthora infestans]KAF4140122.1 hypothetical protein GN958_ATG10685 [Phytophthora infestans]